MSWLANWQSSGWAVDRCQMTALVPLFVMQSLSQSALTIFSPYFIFTPTCDRGDRKLRQTCRDQRGDDCLNDRGKQSTALALARWVLDVRRDDGCEGLFFLANRHTQTKQISMEIRAKRSSSSILSTTTTITTLYACSSWLATSYWKIPLACLL